VEEIEMLWVKAAHLASTKALCLEWCLALGIASSLLKSIYSGWNTRNLTTTFYFIYIWGWQFLNEICSFEKSV
jgi:hypothetical protein